MKKALILVVLLLVVFIGEMLMFENNNHSKEQIPYVTVTSFPLFEIATKLLNDKVDVHKLIPFGVEMHTYTPSVKTMTEVHKAKFFIYNGLGIEPWIKKEYINGLDMSRFIQVNKEVETHEHGHNHGKEGIDPHYWLDIGNMIRMTDTLAEKFALSFPQYEELIKQNAKNYINELTSLQLAYKNALSLCKRDEIVVNHNAFGYLAHEYGFSVHSVTGLSPDEQVSAKNLTEITDLVKEEGIETIFFESFISPKVSETIAKETGAKVQSLQPLANVTEAEADKGYIILMQENLEKLSAAMECI